MLEHLENAFFEVRKYLMDKGLERLETLRKNAKGDVTKQFDFEAEGLVINYLAKNIEEPIKIITEERGELQTKKGTPKWVAVIDPVDGSKNFGRKIESTAFSIGLLPAEKELKVQNVKYALVGLVWSGTIFKAEKGRGAYRNNELIRSSKTENLENAMVTIDVKKHGEQLDRILPLLKSVREMRKFATSATEQAFVACAATDAHIDYRDLLTAENFFGGYLIVKEGGGEFTDEKGQELPAIEDMTKGYNIVVSGNKKLHEQILEKLFP